MKIEQALNPNQALPITLKDSSGAMHEFKPDPKGMYNLNDMHKRLRLSDRKEPSQWRTSISRGLQSSENLQKVDKVASFATEKAAIAYAMWVSYEFYMVVVDVFIAVRNNALASAIVSAELAGEQQALVKQNSRIVNRFYRWMKSETLSWDKAALLAGIEHPNKAKLSMFSRGYLRKTTRLHYGKQITEYLPTEKGERVGIVSKYLGWAGYQFHFTKLGRKWLSDVSDQINAETRIM